MKNSRLSIKRFLNTSHQSRFEDKRIWIITFALVAMLITSVPYLMGYGFQSDEWRFSGFVFGVEDGNTYLAKMLRGAQGDWIFRTPFTTFDQGGMFAFFPYLLLGKLTGGENQHDQLVALYHLFRISGGILAVISTYDFASLYIDKENNRRFAVVLVTFGGGVGWLLVLLGQKNWLGSLPLDFYSPESFGFLGTYGIAHLPWARAFLLWGLRGFIVSGENNLENQPMCSIANLNPGVLWLITGIFQPITGILAGVIIGYFLLGLLIWELYNHWRMDQGNWEIVKLKIKVAVKNGLIALPLAIYYFIMFYFDPFVKIWSEQSQIPPPNYFHYLVAYGMILPFVFLGVIVLLKKPTNRGISLISWAVLSPILLAVPFSQNRRFIEGFWVALVVLAFVAKEKIQWKWFQKSYYTLGFSYITTIFLIIGGINISTNPSEPVFRKAEEVVIFNYLSKYAEDSEVILSSYETGNALPAWTPVFVVIGHRPESAEIKIATPLVEAFFQQNTRKENRIEILEQFRVDYVVWGPHERALGGWDPSTTEYLKLVYSKGEYYVFKVMDLAKS
jgi:hypothetical protein